MAGRDSLGSIGEFGLIDRIAAIAGSGRAIVGIGDDCAVIDQPGSSYLLATVDMLVEEVHFRLSAIGPFDLGRRAVAVNMSDVAAMGGLPTFALTSLALPAGIDVRFVEDLYRGMRDQAERFGAGIVGGNIARTSGPLALDVCMLGEVPKSEVVLRKGARVGDVLVVTGPLGEAAAARLVTDAPGSLRPHGFEDLRERRLVPEPRVEVGRQLAASGAAHAMLDISDGLASDVHHLTGSGNVGAVIYRERLPVSEITRRAAEALHVDAYDLALYGGEDYELLAAVPRTRLETMSETIGGHTLYPVGIVLPPAEGVLLETAGGHREPLEPQGWRHF